MTSFFTGRSGSILSVRSVENARADCEDRPATWIVVKGMVDGANHGDFDTALALAGTELDGTTSVHLHVSDVDFIDVGGVRVLATFARQVKETGREVRTCGARPTLRRTAQILDLGGDLGLS